MLLKEQPIVFRAGKRYEILEGFEVKADAYRRFNKLKRFIWYKDNLRVEHLYYGYGIYILKDVEIEQMELK
jgi:hypothetical protein